MVIIAFVKNAEIRRRGVEKVMEEKKLYYCEKCNKTMGGDQFYTSNNLEKYKEDGKLP